MCQRYINHTVTYTSVHFFRRLIACLTVLGHMTNKWWNQNPNCPLTLFSSLMERITANVLQKGRLSQQTTGSVASHLLLLLGDLLLLAKTLNTASFFLQILVVRVCFFGHFLVHLDACPAACSLAPFIFLCARPPSSHLRHLLIWWWRGGARDEGGAEAGGEMESPEIRARSGKGHTRQRTPWAGRARPRGSEGVQRRDLGRGPGGGEQQKNKHAPGGGRAVGCAGAGPGSPPGTGPIRVPGSARRPGEMRLGGGAGRPVRAPSRHSTDLLHIGFSAPPTGGGSRAEAMTSSQRPEVVECKKLPTCDQNKRERGEREEKKHTHKTLCPAY